MDQVLSRRLPRKRFSNLLGGPRGGGMCGDGDVQDAPSMVGGHHQHEQQPAGGCRDYEEIGGRDLLQVIRQEGAPGLRRRSRRPAHVCCDGGLTRGEAKLQEFAMDSRCTPERIGLRLRADQRPHHSRNARSTRSRLFQAHNSRNPRRCQAMTVFRSDDDEDRSSLMPNPRKPDPEQAVA
jgi:hypothetical protein